MMVVKSFMRSLCVLLIGLLLQGCFEKKPIKIGFLGAITGRRSEMGVSARNSAMLAIDEINRAGGINGRPLQLVVQDNKGETSTNRNAVKALIDEGVVAILGPYMSQMASSALETLNDSDVIVFSPTVSSDELTGVDDRFLRVMPASSQQALAMAEAIKRDGLKSIAIVYDSANRKYTEPIFKQLSQKHKNISGNKVVYVNDLRSGGNISFKHLAAQIVNSDAEGLAIITSGIDAAALCQQIRKITSETKFYGAYWVKTGKIIERGGKSVEGMTLVTTYESNPRTEAYLTFRKSFNEKYKESPGFVASHTYDSIKVIVKGLSESDEISGGSLKKAILEISKFQGLEETFMIDKFGDVQRKHMTVVIKNGTFVRTSE